LDSDDSLRVVGLFDNEEVGSDSLMGAGSTMMRSVLERLHGTSGEYLRSIPRSLLVSADMAHGIHPNWPECHEENHRCQLQKGLVLKENANLRYATNSISAFFIEEAARECGGKVQKFAVRNDTQCGSTIGPILSTSLGMRTVDVGVPQLSMHSIREMCGVQDVIEAHSIFVHLFKNYSKINNKLIVKGE